VRTHAGLAFLCISVLGDCALADDVAVTRHDYQIDSVDLGIRISVREVMASGASAFAEDRVVVFVHGTGLPSRPAFDIPDRNASWAEWMARRGYAVYLFDFRNCGWSTRERAMAEPPDRNPAPSRTYLLLRDLGAVVDHVRARRAVKTVNVVGWSWGGTVAGWYASLQPEKVRRLVLYAAVYSGRQEPRAFEPEGAWSLYPATAPALRERFLKVFPPQPGEPPWEDSIFEALATELGASDPTSGSRDPPSIRVPAGAAEDGHNSRIGRPLYNASSIYSPTLVIGGAADAIVPPEHREALLRDLAHAPVKREVIVPGGTHVTQFQRRRDDLFRAVEAFLAEPIPAQPAR
jgi:pimeloyl-ACP methyl ester carboxylesterase